MPTARPQTQMMTSESTPSLYSSSTQRRKRLGGVTRARAMLKPKIAICPSVSTKRVAAQPRSWITPLMLPSLDRAIRPDRQELDRRVGRRHRLVDVLAEEARHARI